MSRYKCTLCDYSTDHKTKFTEHSKIHLPRDYKCEKCPRAFRSVIDLQTHVDKQHGNHYCDLCDAKFGSSKIRDNHKR